MATDDRILSSFERCAQEYHKELTDYLYLTAAVGAAIVCVFFGVYFSQFAISQAIGATNAMQVFGWAAAILISGLEVGGVKLLGNKTRSDGIKMSNRLEHTIAYWATIGLFAFDVLTNLTGMFWFALEKNHITSIPISSIGTWVIIISFGILLGISELLVGWAIRGRATAYVSYRQAKVKYDVYKEKLEESIANDSKKEFETSGFSKQTTSNKPSFDTPFLKSKKQPAGVKTYPAETRIVTEDEN